MLFKNLFKQYFKLLFGFDYPVNDWSVVWSKSTKWSKENSSIVNITYCVIYYSESRKKYYLDIKGKYNSEMLCYKQAINVINHLKSTIPDE